MLLSIGCGMAGCTCAIGLAWWAPTDMPSMSLARPEESRAGSRSALGEGAEMSDEEYRKEGTAVEVPNLTCLSSY